MNVAGFNQVFGKKFSPELPEGAESPDLARCRSLVWEAVNLHIKMKAEEGEVTAAHVGNLIEAVRDIFSEMLCKIDVFNEMYGDVIRPLDLIHDALRQSTHEKIAAALQSIYAESANPLGRHSHTSAGSHFAEVSGTPGQADNHESA